ncbi:hypothetical protein [Clostridium grantii]|uniref:Uncharacterized protein n=1 Tax=Clostridium grantii DSM 8605 TaxID=1121316 RepID=A0A1M5XM76_9CLOT|nr:hypothetical protein [Clostridium grantii]SHI00930.1 hypothetical protein SAMN02745207_03780 [Clostridium grantii DSM 8605]
MNFENDKNLWFQKFINHRYLITTKWFEDEEDNYYEFVYIADIKENNKIKYEGACEIYNNHLILYDEFWD